MNQQLLQAFMRGVLDLIMFLRKDYECNRCQILIQAIQRFRINKISPHSLSNWLMNIMGIHKHYFDLENIALDMDQVQLIFRLVDENGIKIKFTEQWSFETLKTVRNSSVERVEYEIKRTLLQILKILQKNPLTKLLDKYRSYSKQYSLYYIISRLENRRTKMFQDKINFQSPLSNYIFNMNIYFQNCPSQHSQRNQLLKINNVTQNIKRKQSHSTMNSSTGSLSCIQSIYQFQQQMTFNFQQQIMSETSSNNVSIVFDQLSDEQYQVIEQQESTKLRKFKQTLLTISENIVQPQFFY